MRTSTKCGRIARRLLILQCGIAICRYRLLCCSHSFFRFSVVIWGAKKVLFFSAFASKDNYTLSNKREYRSFDASFVSLCLDAADPFSTTTNHKQMKGRQRQAGRQTIYCADRQTDDRGLHTEADRQKGSKTIFAYLALCVCSGNVIRLFCRYWCYYSRCGCCCCSYCILWLLQRQEKWYM